MEQNSTFDTQVIQIITGALNKEEGSITRDTQIIQDLHIKSMHMIAVLARVEDELDIMVTMNEAGKAKTIGELIDLIAELKE